MGTTDVEIAEVGGGAVLDGAVVDSVPQAATDEPIASAQTSAIGPVRRRSPARW